MSNEAQAAEETSETLMRVHALATRRARAAFICLLLKICIAMTALLRDLAAECAALQESARAAHVCALDAVVEAAGAPRLTRERGTATSSPVDASFRSTARLRSRSKRQTQRWTPG
jgi:hypothetical protein